jgi:hypothetical protein
MAAGDRQVTDAQIRSQRLSIELFLPACRDQRRHTVADDVHGCPAHRRRPVHEGAVMAGRVDEVRMADPVGRASCARQILRFRGARQVRRNDDNTCRRHCRCARCPPKSRSGHCGAPFATAAWVVVHPRMRHWILVFRRSPDGRFFDDAVARSRTSSSW